MKIHSIIWKEEKWYVAKALEVEVASQGKTKRQALENLKEALELYFEDRSNIELNPIEEPKLENLTINA